MKQVVEGLVHALQQVGVWSATMRIEDAANPAHAISLRMSLGGRSQGEFRLI